MFQIDPQNGPHIAIVVSPLRSLMNDQVERCKNMGIMCTMLTACSEMTKESADSKYTL